MKKLLSSVSPYLMMIIPVILFISLSFVLKEQPAAEEFSVTQVESKTAMMVQAGELSVKQSLVKLLLKK